MRKIVCLLFAFAMIICLCSCGESKTEVIAVTDNTTGLLNDVEQPSDIVSNDVIEVDEGLIFVEITVPATFLEGATEESIKATAEESGFTDCVVHENGSVTYKMTKEKHKEVMLEVKTSLESTIEDFISGDNAVPSFLKVEYPDDFSRFDVYVDPTLYSDWEGFYVMMFYFLGEYYQIFEGRDFDDVYVLVNYINNDTNEVIYSGSFPESDVNTEITS